MDAIRIIPEGGKNVYADHPGFTATNCHLRHTVTPAGHSSSYPGFACLYTGGHCIPGDYCEQRQKKSP